MNTMKENLTRLYNTMSMIETKGENTKMMGDCLRFVEQLIAVETDKENQNATAPAPVEEEE